MRAQFWVLMLFHIASISSLRYRWHPIAPRKGHYSKRMQRYRLSSPRRAEANTEQRIEVNAIKIPRNFNPEPFEYHSKIELVIEDLTNLGLGIGRTELPDGPRWVVMVPLVVPGE